MPKQSRSKRAVGRGCPSRPSSLDSARSAPASCPQAARREHAGHMAAKASAVAHIGWTIVLLEFVIGGSRASLTVDLVAPGDRAEKLQASETHAPQDPTATYYSYNDPARADKREEEAAEALNRERDSREGDSEGAAVVPATALFSTSHGAQVGATHLTTDRGRGSTNGPGGAEPPSPSPPPPTVTASSRQMDAAYWTHDATLRTSSLGGSSGADGTELKIKGVSWFGLDSMPCVLGGLDKVPLGSLAAFLKEAGFNAVRLPLAVSALATDKPDGGCMPPALAILVDDAVEPAAGESGLTFVGGGAGGPGGARSYQQHNDWLLGLSYLQTIAKIITVLGDHGLLVMLDAHAEVAGKWPDEGKVGDMAALRTAWTRLTTTFCDPSRYWNVFASDLKNEPHGMCVQALGEDSHLELDSKLARRTPRPRFLSSAALPKPSEPWTRCAECRESCSQVLGPAHGASPLLRPPGSMGHPRRRTGQRCAQRVPAMADIRRRRWSLHVGPSRGVRRSECGGPGHERDGFLGGESASSADAPDPARYAKQSRAHAARLRPLGPQPALLQRPRLPSKHAQNLAHAVGSRDDGDRIQ